MHTLLCTFVIEETYTKVYNIIAKRWGAHSGRDCGNQILKEQIYAAIAELPEKQAKRIYAHFYLGMSMTEIARAEGVTKARISQSIKYGLHNLSKKLKNFMSRAKQIIRKCHGY